MRHPQEIWVEPAGAGDIPRRVAGRALEAGFETLLLAPGSDGLEGVGRFRRLAVRDGELCEGERRIGPVIELVGPDDLGRAMALAGQAVTVLLRARDWKVIPLENLVAAYQGTPTRIVGEATSAAEAVTLLATLEKGTDGVVLRTADPEQVAALGRELAARRGEHLDLIAAEVINLAAVGCGDRACLDTASLLGEGEGLLVGSQSAQLALVQAETRESGWVAARPFRVNAGPVHAYTLVPGGRTRYLSELVAGDPVLVVDRSGGARPAVLGRVKIERRPLILVRFRSESAEGSLLLQNAETVRLVGEHDSPSVAELGPGSRILVHAPGRARHFGMAIDESIRER